MAAQVIRPDQIQLCWLWLLLTVCIREASVNQTMPRFPLCFLLSFCFVRARTYQPKQLSLTHSDPAALEEVPAAAEYHEALVVSCEENSIEIRMRPHLLDPAELVRMRLGPPGRGRDGCAARRSAYGELVIGAPLAECGSRMMVG